MIFEMILREFTSADSGDSNVKSIDVQKVVKSTVVLGVVRGRCKDEKMRRLQMRTSEGVDELCVQENKGGSVRDANALTMNRPSQVWRLTVVRFVGRQRGRFSCIVDA